MTTQTMYHVTDESNVDSIMTEGIQPGPQGEIYLTDSANDARMLGDVYPSIEDPVVLAADVMECNIHEGPGDAGDIAEFVKRGPIMPVDVEVQDR